MLEQGKRLHPRIKAHIQCVVQAKANHVGGLLRDLTARGAKIALQEPRPFTGRVKIHIPSSDVILNAHVRWMRGPEIGVEFESDVEPILLQCTELREHLKKGPATSRPPARPK